MAQADFDVAVVGAGNAALCAALAAREGAERVVVLERAPESERGGNSHFTAGLVRVPYEGADDLRTLVGNWDERRIEVGAYPAAEFRSDLERLTEGQTDPALADVLVREAASTLRWLRSRGGEYQLALSQGRQAFESRGVLRFWGGAAVEFAGGGAAHVARLIELCRAAGIEIRYEARATELLLRSDGGVQGVRLRTPEGEQVLHAKAVVLASGGFEASAELRARHLGAQWRDVAVRGSRHNTGDGIEMALAAGAAPAGDWGGCHAVAWDANAPPFGDLRITNGFNRHSYPFGITVNQRGERFLDEGADFRNYTYAKYGAAILEQPGGVAYQIFDTRTETLLREEYQLPETTRVRADDPAKLATGLGIDVARFVETLRSFNAAVSDAPFDPARLDGKGTRGVSPPKSHWAQPLDRPPYTAYAARCGITFTFGGLRVDPNGRVLRVDGSEIPGLHAAGELVGGLFHHNYPGGAGLTSGSVFGRLAGRSAAGFARS